MKRTTWSQRIRAILHSEGSKPVRETLAAYDRLLESSQRGARSGVSDWDVAEVMFLRSFFLEQCGRSREALAGYLKLAELRRSYIKGHGHSLASTLEAAVLVAVKAGERRKALVLAQEVVKLRGEFPDGTAALEDVVRLLHEEQRRQSRRAGRKQMGKLASLLTLDYLSDRGTRGKRSAYNRVLRRVRDAPSEEGDALPSRGTKQTKRG